MSVTVQYTHTVLYGTCIQHYCNYTAAVGMYMYGTCSQENGRISIQVRKPSSHHQKLQRWKSPRTANGSSKGHSSH